MTGIGNCPICNSILKSERFTNDEGMTVEEYSTCPQKHYSYARLYNVLIININGTEFAYTEGMTQETILEMNMKQQELIHSLQ